MIDRFRAAPRSIRLAAYAAMLVLTPIAGWLGYRIGFFLGQN